MKAKEIKISELKVGDKVKYTSKVIEGYEKMLQDNKAIKSFGRELILKILNNHKQEFIVESITLDQMDNKTPLVWLKGKRGASFVNQLIKL